MRASGGGARLVADVWHPRFGIERPSLCLEIVVEGDACQLQMSWAKEGGRCKARLAPDEMATQ